MKYLPLAMCLVGLSANADEGYSVTFEPSQEIAINRLGLSGDITKYNVCNDGINQYGRCTQIKNQGNYGTCWAFATIGVVENILHFTHPDSGTYDLSEQYLVSCNKWWYNDTGGWQSFDLFTNTGVVYSRDLKYVGVKTSIDCDSQPHHEKIAGWHALNRNPSVDDIKKAIVRYGPVLSTVCVNDAFRHYYGSGVFSGQCDNITGLTSHMVVLVGWDDNDGNGYWILRNSWGQNWGEGGYMRIAYGSNFVGNKVFVAESFDFIPPPPGSNIYDTGCSSTTGNTWLAVFGAFFMMAMWPARRRVTA
jgi:hypothetical protein